MSSLMRSSLVVRRRLARPRGYAHAVSRTALAELQAWYQSQCDGVQNEGVVLEPAIRAELARRLAATGLARVEAASFVNPKLVPQMAGAEEVIAALDGATEYTGLVLNARGYERLAAAGLTRANLTLAATDTFNRRNGNRSLEEAIADAEAILATAELPVTVTLSVAFGCPFEGAVDPGVVTALAERLAAGGADELVLADTIGVATPRPVAHLTERLLVLGRPVGGHFHDTRHTGI